MSTELDRSLSREGDDTAARGQFHLVLSGKPLEATTHRGMANIARSKHFICVRMLLSMHSVIIDLCDIHIHISTCCYLTIPTSSVPRAVRFNWHLLYLLPLHVFSLHLSHGQVRRTLIAHLSIRWLNLRVELTFLSSQVNLCLSSQTTNAVSRM